MRVPSIICCRLRAGCECGIDIKKGELAFALRALLAEWTGLEPATPGVTGRYSNQLNYHSPGPLRIPLSHRLSNWWVLTGSNRRHSPCKGDALPTELSTHAPIADEPRSPPTGLAPPTPSWHKHRQSSSSVYSILECFSSTELRNLRGANPDHLAGAWIATCARGPLADEERAEPDEGHDVAALQRPGDGTKRGVERAPRGGLGNVGMARDGVDEFGFVHCAFPRMVDRREDGHRARGRCDTVMRSSRGKKRAKGPYSNRIFRMSSELRAQRFTAPARTGGATRRRRRPIPRSVSA